MSDRTTGLFAREVSSPFGTLAVAWSVRDGIPLVSRVLLPGGVRPPGLARRSCMEIESVVRGMTAFLSGESVDFPVDVIRLDLCGGFQRRVLLEERLVPRGMVTSYSSIAASLGAPGAARAVGGALAANPFPILVPCHRAVRADGSPGGFQGGTGMKRSLLVMEGVAFDEDGLVRRSSFVPAVSRRPQPSRTRTSRT